MSNFTTVCGTDCGKCNHLENSKCEGCEKLEGHVFRTEHISTDIRPVYDCVVNKRQAAHDGIILKSHADYGVICSIPVTPKSNMREYQRTFYAP